MEGLRTTHKDDEDEQWCDALDHIPLSQTDSENPSSFSPPPPPPPTLHHSPPPPPPPMEEDEDEEEDDFEEVVEPNQEPNANGYAPSLLPNSELPESLNSPILPFTLQPESDDYEDDDDTSARKKQKPLACFTSPSSPSPPAPPASAAIAATATKKPKKKNNVWTKSTSRKGKKKAKPAANVAPEDTVLITPIPRFPDKSDDSPDASICLSRVYKAEKVELSEDRLTAGSTKGYRMVRATRGVTEGAWYFEMRVVKLGETGHTRLGWTMDKGDLQAPVGYDGNSFGYRDLDGSKVHKALREKYGDEGYAEGDVIGFYISLPEGGVYAPKPPHLVWYKGQRYMYSADGKDEPPKVVPGSDISFFKNGVCQGAAFRDLFGGRYYPAASMYTLPNQPNCEVRFNFGPDFEFFPQDFGDRPTPQPMIEVPYHGYDGRVEGPAENGLPEKKN